MKSLRSRPRWRNEELHLLAGLPLFEFADRALNPAPSHAARVIARRHRLPVHLAALIAAHAGFAAFGGFPHD